MVTFIQTRDRAEAKAFYGDMLGFALVADDRFASVFEMNGTVLRVTEIADYVAHAHPALGWKVADIAESSRWLRARGLTMTIYPGFGQDENGVWTSPDGEAKVVWFNDPDGNVLTLTQS